ncbi:MAG TPA: serine protease [Vicinamibacterales bacterium]|nr:serine protease [Vicinamibacterales bacterium]
MTKQALTGILAVLTLWAGAAGAQDFRVGARDVIRKWQDAVVNVRIVLKVRMSMGGREVQAMDDSVDTVGTVIDPSGLTVLSLRTLNPGGMMNKLMGSAGGGQPPMEITSEPSDVKIRLADGEELPAKIVLRDEDLDLAFLRPTTAPGKPLVAVSLSDSGRPAVLDEVLVLSRLGRVGAWTASASVYDIGAIIEKPRTFFVLAGTTPAGMGVPAFLANGRIVGLLTLRQVETARTGMFAMIGGTEGMGLLPVILPAADVLEIAEQAK